MTYQAHVREGVIVLDDPVDLPEGAVAQVILTEKECADTEVVPGSFYDEFKEFIGMAKGLPADLAEQHDHYLHGTPTINTAHMPLQEGLLRFSGIIKSEYPSDYALNHEHYKYGTPKR